MEKKHLPNGKGSPEHQAKKYSDGNTVLEEITSFVSNVTQRLWLSRWIAYCEVRFSNWPPFHLYITLQLFSWCFYPKIWLSRGQSPLEQYGVMGRAQGPNSCTDLIVATLGLERQRFQVPVKHLSHWAKGCTLICHFNWLIKSLPLHHS